MEGCQKKNKNYSDAILSKSPTRKLPSHARENLIYLLPASIQAQEFYHQLNLQLCK